MTIEYQTVTIRLKEYTDLLNSDAMLKALKAHGVDNWEGYYYALNEVYGDDEEY